MTKTDDEYVVIGIIEAGCNMIAQGLIDGKPDDPKDFIKKFKYSDIRR